MKKLAIIFTAIAALAGCQKESTLHLNTDNVVMYSLDEHTITSNGTNVSFMSQNPYIASVNKTTGVVTGMHLGETYIDVIADQGTAKVKVTIKPKHYVIIDPYIHWGASKSDILNEVGGKLLEEDDDMLMYLYGDANYGDPHIGTSYVFKDGKLNSIIVVINKEYYADAVLHLAERFQYFGEKGGMIVFGDALQEESVDTIVSIAKYSGQYVILYSQNN